MNHELKIKIMRRVYAIWFIKNVAPVLFLELPILLLIALHETAREFFVAKIFENTAVAFSQGGAFGRESLAHFCRKLAVYFG